MPRPQPPFRTLADLPARDGDRVTVVIETPKGSPNTYGYDHGLGAFRLDAVLPEGVVFPFGFVPSTVGGRRDVRRAHELLEDGMARAARER